MTNTDIEVTDTDDTPHLFQSSNDDPIGVAVIDGALILYKNPKEPFAGFAAGQWRSWTRIAEKEPVTTPDESAGSTDDPPGIHRVKIGDLGTVTINVTGSTVNAEALRRAWPFGADK